MIQFIMQMNLIASIRYNLSSLKEKKLKKGQID
jgi:hypothetical protein